MTDDQKLQDLWEELDKLTEIVNKQAKQIKWLNNTVNDLKDGEKRASGIRRAREIVERITEEE